MFGGLTCTCSLACRATAACVPCEEDIVPSPFDELQTSVFVKAQSRKLGFFFTADTRETIGQQPCVLCVLVEFELPP
ncbi:hypothetical protein CSUI_001908 [Cystoisospora suis]|uniref:Secreted protein n=1 Tax=Cystoisospora suis TaxID=483139 RepID=A0A2C6LB02_9APIC|nr:hypothetical protein CSUI_001908 [Cystoisospora suis]